MTTQDSPFIRNKLRLSITGCCNLNCFYCHNEGQGHEGSAFMDPVLAEQIADYVRRAHFQIGKVNLTGGEPLIHPELDRIIQAFSGVCGEIRLNTNGLLLTKERIDALASLDVTELKIGIDSLWNQMETDRIKYTDRKQLEELICYAAGRCSVVLNMVITSHNAERIDEMIAFCEQHDIPRLKLNELVELDSSRTDSCREQVSDIFLDACRRWRKRAVTDEVVTELGREEMVLPSGVRLIWCRSFCATRACGSMYTIIDSSGAIITCSKLSEKVQVDFSVDRPHREITADIRRAQETICSVRRRYLRDIKGNRILLTRDRTWDWSLEKNPYWRTPEPIAFGYAERWKTLFPRGKLLDLGAGMGRHIPVFFDAGFDVTALDVSDFAIAEIRKRYDSGIRTVCADMKEMPFPDASFNALFSYHAISHTDAFLMETIIAELYRVLKPGGEAFLTLCSKSSPNFHNLDYPRIDDCTILKLKAGPEYGVAHYYTDFESIPGIFADFHLIHVSEVNDLWYDGCRHQSNHFHLLIQKPLS